LEYFYHLVALSDVYTAIIAATRGNGSIIIEPGILFNFRFQRKLKFKKEPPSGKLSPRPKPPSAVLDAKTLSHRAEASRFYFRRRRK
jgi:hypothetical protein